MSPSAFRVVPCKHGFFSLLFCLPTGMKSPGKMRPDWWCRQAASLAPFLSAFTSPLEAAVKETENNPIVFARGVPTITPLGNGGGCPFPFFKKLHCCSQWMLKFCYHDSTAVYQLLHTFRGGRLQKRNGILLFVLLVARAVGYPCVLACTDLCPYALYTLSRRSSSLTVLLASSVGACCEGAPMPRHAQSARSIRAEMWESCHIASQCVYVCVRARMWEWRTCGLVRWSCEVWQFIQRQAEDWCGVCRRLVCRTETSLSDREIIRNLSIESWSHPVSGRITTIFLIPSLNRSVVLLDPVLF